MLAMVKNKKKKIQIANAYQQCLETGLGVNATAPRVKIQDFIISWTEKKGKTKKMKKSQC